MTDAAYVLHVFAQPSPETAEVISVLERCGVVVRDVADCYEAMAELVCGKAQQLTAVLVCLSGLMRADREFFQLAGRRFRAVPIYVYGPDSPEINARWAVEAGARQRARPGELPDLVVPTAAPGVAPPVRSAILPPTAGGPPAAERRSDAPQAGARARPHSAIRNAGVSSRSGLATPSASGWGAQHPESPLS